MTTHGRYMMAMFRADGVLQQLGPKITSGIPLTQAEGEKLLNANWKVYLCAVADGDIQEAKGVNEFIDELAEYLTLRCGYTVRLSGSHYEVIKRRGKQAKSK